MGNLTVVVTGSLTAAAVAASSFGTYPNVMVGLNYQKNHDALVVHIQPLEKFYLLYLQISKKTVIYLSLSTSSSLNKIQFSTWISRK